MPASMHLSPHIVMFTLHTLTSQCIPHSLCSHIPHTSHTLTFTPSQVSRSAHAPSPPILYEDFDKLDGGQNSLEISPQPPTIDQLLTEIEQECHGPDYKYFPSGGRDPSEGAWEGPHSSVTPANSGRQKNSSQTPHSKATSFDGYNTRRRLSFDSSIDYLPPDEMRAVQNAVDRTFRDYETIPFQPPTSSDEETYVYMAPHRDIQSSNPQPPHSR